MNKIASSDTSIRTDASGNMTRIPNPRFGETSASAAGFFYATRRFAASGSTQPQNLNLTYDAWNRLVRVTSPDGTLVAEYRYDALNRRVTKTTSTETRRFYYNRNWQCIQEVVENQPATHYVWGLRYIDDLICRIVGLDKIYSLSDPNWNVVALTDSAGTPVERYTYTAFGKPNIYDGNFTPRNASNYAWTRTFTGQVLDAETGLMLYRNRFYSPMLGRFLTRDPIGYEGMDENLYRYAQNSSNFLVDEMGNIATAIVIAIVGVVATVVIGGTQIYISLTQSEKCVPNSPVLAPCKTVKNCSRTCRNRNLRFWGWNDQKIEGKYTIQYDCFCNCKGKYEPTSNAKVEIIGDCNAPPCPSGTYDLNIGCSYEG